MRFLFDGQGRTFFVFYPFVRRMFVNFFEFTGKITNKPCQISFFETYTMNEKTSQQMNELKHNFREFSPKR